MFSLCFILMIAGVIIVSILIGKGITAIAKDAGFDTTSNKKESIDIHPRIPGYRSKYHSKFDKADKYLNMNNR